MASWAFGAGRRVGDLANVEGAQLSSIGCTPLVPLHQQASTLLVHVVDHRLIS